MRDSNDKLTADLLGQKKRGRPATGKAKSDAQRQRDRRERMAEELEFWRKWYEDRPNDELMADLTNSVLKCLDDTSEHLWRELGRRHGWVG